MEVQNIKRSQNYCTDKLQCKISQNSQPKSGMKSDYICQGIKIHKQEKKQKEISFAMHFSYLILKVSNIVFTILELPSVGTDSLDNFHH